MAEHTSVKTLPVTDLQAGMKVHTDILGYKGKTLVAAGEVLTIKHVQKLKQWEQREKPQGPALPKKNPKDSVERTRFAEWQGGWRPSHFNQGGVPVSTAFGSVDAAPKVEQNPELSPMIQGIPRKTFAIGGDGIESPLFRQKTLEAEIQSLASTNAQLGGKFDVAAMMPGLGTFLNGGEEKMVSLKDALSTDNQRLIADLRAPKADATAHPPARGTGKKGGR